MAALNQSDVYIWYRSTKSLDDEAVKSADQHPRLKNGLAAIDSISKSIRRDFTMA